MLVRSTSGALTAAMVLMISAGLAQAQSSTVTGQITAKGLPNSAGIVVSLEAPGLKVTPPAQPIEMDQKGMTFLTHVLPVMRGTTVRFLNSDAVGHNVFSPEGRYNLGTWPKGETRDHTFNKPGVYTQLCRVHPEMEAFVVVLDTPYFATTDSTGTFDMTNVPPGKYTLVAWSEKLKTARQVVSVEAGKSATVSLTLTK